MREPPRPGSGCAPHTATPHPCVTPSGPRTTATPPACPGPRSVLRLHQAFSVLPGAAIYTALIEHGVTSADATRTVHHALTAMARPRARIVQRLTATEHGGRLFMRAAVVASPHLFPDPGWHAQWRARTPARVAFDMTRCYDLDMLRLLDATAIAPAYCAVDDTLYSHLHPQIRWHRTGTLATGSTHCDFCFTHQTGAAAG